MENDGRITNRKITVRALTCLHRQNPIDQGAARHDDYTSALPKYSTTFGNQCNTDRITQFHGHQAVAQTALT